MDPKTFCLHIQRILISFSKRLLSFIGIFSLGMILLAFTNVPYYAYHRLGMTSMYQSSQIDYIILLGGDGMPSPSGLIRSYYASEIALKNPKATIFIALPKNEDGSLYQLKLLSMEFKNRGISTSRVRFEPEGYNTHSQAKNLAKQIPDKNKKVIIVTSPEHMYRAVKCFQKEGFSNLASLATFEIPSDEEKLKNKTPHSKDKIPNLSLRYNLWSYLIYEIKVLREYAAISYYWMKDWI